MTKEEMQRHANEISNKYVPGLLAADEKIVQEIAGLPIQDIITIRNNALWAAANGADGSGRLMTFLRLRTIRLS